MNLLAYNDRFVHAHNNGQVATITETVLGFIPLLSYMSMTPFVLLPSKTQDIGNYQYMMDSASCLVIPTQRW